MIVEILSVGTELLLGDILNTNVQFLSRECAALGFNLYHTGVVGDHGERIEEELRRALSRSDIVILTGGLGTTEDDLTKEIVVKVTGRGTTYDREAFKANGDWFMHTPEYKLREMDIAFPKGSTILKNSVGLAFGAWIPVENKHIAILPGPPREMETMFLDELKPILRELSSGRIASREVKLGVLGEYRAAARMNEMIPEQTNPTFATYAKDDGVTIRVTAKGKDAEEADQLLEDGVKRIREIFSTDIITDSGERKETIIENILKERGEKVSTAESLTGGMIASAFVDIPGASDVLEESYVVYSDDAKAKILGVSAALIEEKSAVSSEVCMEMAIGLYNRTQSALCVVTTGYAGPTGDAGLVYIGILYRNQLKVHEHRLHGDRTFIRERCRNLALDYCIRILRNGDVLG